jgi:hypothetical protein
MVTEYRFQHYIFAGISLRVRHWRLSTQLGDVIGLRFVNCVEYVRFFVIQCTDSL